MSFIQAHDAFLSIELDLELFEQEIDGVRFWERIRWTVFQTILDDAILPGKSLLERPRSWRTITRALASTARSIVRYNPFRFSDEPLVFVGHPRRVLGPDGRWVDPYCDPIIKGLEGEAVLLESPGHAHHRTPAATERIGHLDLLEAASYLRRATPASQVHFTSSDGQLLRTIEERIHDEMHADIDVGSLVRANLLSRASRLPVLTRLLERLDPALVVLVVSYGKETLIEACQNLAITTAELQHGLISPMHTGYAFPGPQREKNLFPDHLLTWGPFWTNDVALPIPSSRVHPVGAPFLDQARSRHGGEPEQDHVLVLSQPAIGQALSRMTSELAHRTDHNHQITYKLHPAEYDVWKELYPHLLRSPVNVVGSQPSLHELMARAEIQVGVSSTALFEGLAFGLSTILVDLPMSEQLAWLVDASAAVRVGDTEELAKALTGELVSPPPIEAMFTPDAASRACKKIEALLQQA